MRLLFAHLSGEKSRIYGLVLASAGIPYRLHRRGLRWAISIDGAHRTAAANAVRLYLIENPVVTGSHSEDAPTAVKTLSAIYIIPFLILVHWLIAPGYEHRVFVDAFGANARLIMDGEIHRCITALLLHKDWPHVINNVVGLVLFGTVAASICGWGVGWSMILFTGAAGNLATAAWYRQDHLAIGASTAVFGALGLCAALNVWRHFRSARPTWRIWLPLAGGLALLGFLGGSPGSDLMAHLMGFVCGTAIGLLYGGFFRQPPGVAVQCSAAITGGTMVALSWVLGVYSG